VIQIDDSKKMSVLALIILRAGEGDSLKWWDDESLTDAGRLALSRLFPRNAERIAVRLALAGALARQRRVLENAGAAGAITLMDLAADTLRDQIVDLQLFTKRIESMDELRSMLQRTIPGSEFTIPRQGSTGTTLDVSEMANQTKGRLPLALVSGYLMGKVGSLVVPFVRRKALRSK
jgi:hypothetical protein